MIHVFNRSHYEDILIQRVHQWIDEATVERRIRQINDFEKMLVENDTVLIKFYLHVSFEEQLERLQERLTDPKKKWKHNENDMKEREFWPEYMKAYNDVLNRCNEASPWHIIPTDSNRYKEELISGVVRSHLEGLKLEYPQ
jgi:polyphosphate kinase 2 (PPK2 family)